MGDDAYKVSVQAGDGRAYCAARRSLTYASDAVPMTVEAGSGTTAARQAEARVNRLFPGSQARAALCL